MIKDIYKKSLFLTAFFFSKGVVLIVPLLLSEGLNKRDYGIIEYGLSLGLILATFLNLGVPSSYPYFKLKRNYKTIYEGFKVHPLFLLLITTIIAVFSYFIFDKEEYLIAVLIAYVFSNQGMYSMFKKSDGKIVQAVVLDSLIYVFLLLSFFLTTSFEDQQLKIVIYCLIIYGLIYLVKGFSNLSQISLLSIKKHIKLVKYGKNVMLSSFLILLIANSGRIVIDYVFENKELVADYSFYYRMGSMVVIIHQILILIYFKKIYTLPIEKIDNLFFVFISIITFGTILTYIFIPLVGPLFFDMFSNYEKNAKMFQILCLQMIFWIVLANNENIIYREGLASKMNKYFIFLLVIFLAVIISFKEKLNMYNVVFILYLMISIATIIQFYILKKYKKIFLKKTFLFISVTLLISVIIILWNN